ncbi:Hsp70 family protein [Micromonospora sp. NPDC003197]
MLSGPDGRAKPLLFDASPLLPSGVFAGPGDTPLLTGADAERAALTDPAGFEPNPKRRIDDGVIWLAEREVAVTDAIASVLTRVSAEARRVAGGPPGEVVFTHPAGWSRTRLGVLAAAADRAQLGECRFVAEPVAAAAYFADVLGRDLSVGQCLVVYDLGAGTCDVSIVRRTGGGLEVVATAGLDDVGGLDLDAVIVAHARSLTTENTDAWRRLNWPQTPADQRAHQSLWRDARAAKEQLSRHVTADLHIPLVDTVIHLTRDEFETAARPHLDRTTELTTTLLGDAGIPREDIVGVFLVGGSSRVPLVASLLHRTLRIAPTALDHPELVVAEGALHALTEATRPSAEPTPPTSATPAPSAQATPIRPTSATPAPLASGTSAPPMDSPTIGNAHQANRWRPRTPRDRAVVAGAAALVVVIVAGLWIFLPAERPDRAGGQPQATVTDQNPPATATPTSQNSPQATPTATPTDHTDTVQDVAFSPDGKTLATASNDNTVRLRDAGTGATKVVITGHTDSVFDVAFSPDGRTLASASGDDTVRLWDVRTGGFAGILTHTGFVSTVAFSPDGKTLASAGSDRTIQLWDVTTGKSTATLTGHDGVVDGVAFSPDGKTLASASWDYTVRLWEVSSGNPIATFTGHTYMVESVAFSPDGKTLASASGDDTVRLWDVAGRRAAATLRGPDGFGDVAFSPDGRTLATAGRDGVVRLWNVATRKTTTTFTHAGYVTSVAFSPDGRTLASGSTDETVRRWKLGT